MLGAGCFWVRRRCLTHGLCERENRNQLLTAASLELIRNSEGKFGSVALRPSAVAGGRSRCQVLAQCQAGNQLLEGPTKLRQHTRGTDTSEESGTV